MPKMVLTLNAGSSSIKFAVFGVADGRPRLRATGQVEGIGEKGLFHSRDLIDGTRVDRVLDILRPTHHQALEAILEGLGDDHPASEVVAVGHRVVHGGVDFCAPVHVDDAVMASLEALVPLAPQHQPHNLEGIRAAREAFGAAAQVACFDTAFHRDHPFVSDTFALPRRFYDEGVRRYGFHGLSYEYVTARLREIAPTEAAGNVVIAHLGNGASMCAVKGGRSIASTMGFTALDGLPMGSRCGQLDPGVVLYLMREKGMGADEIADVLYNSSGLKGLSNLSNDMRELEASDSREARDAIDYFVARIRRELGGLALSLPWLDGIVFCGGIGENAWRVRAAVLADLEWLGIEIDREANQAGAELISTPESRVRVRVIRTDEEAMIARHTLQVLSSVPAAAAA